MLIVHDQCQQYDLWVTAKKKQAYSKKHRQMLFSNLQKLADTVIGFMSGGSGAADLHDMQLRWMRISAI